MEPLTTEKARLDAILGDVEGIIVFSNTVANGYELFAHIFYASEGLGIDAVNKCQNEIEKPASMYGVDSDLMKAILFLENSHGWCGALKPYIAMQEETIRPRNINVITLLEVAFA